VGVLAFLALVAGPALRGGAFERRAWLLVALGAGLGVVVGVLGVLLQGAEAAGLSLWSSVRWSVISSTLDSRFGWVWGIRAALLALTLVVLALPRHRLRGVWLAGVGAYLVITPALAGHASIQSPVWVFFPVNVLHVLAASVWVGGIVAIVLALPLATRAVEPAQRTRLLLDVLGRFSPLALAAVAVIACTGIVEAYIDVRTVHALTTTTYGELVLLKTGLLGILIGLGAINRERIIPTLRRLVAAAATPAQTGVLLRQTTRGELAAMASVFGVTAALVAFAPPIDVANGDCAAGLCIDFYGRQQDEAVRRRGDSERLGFATPAGGSAYSADTVALLRGAPHRRVAEAFIEYVLSMDGQKLWNLRTGTPGGPRDFALRRLPIRRDFYSDSELQGLRSDPDANPYAEGADVDYHPEWTGGLFRELAFIVRILSEDTHGELVAAWRAIQTAPEPERSEALSVLQDMSAVSYIRAEYPIRRALESKDQADELRLARDLDERFRRQYARAEALALGREGTGRPPTASN